MLLGMSAIAGSLQGQPVTTTGVYVPSRDWVFFLPEERAAYVRSRLISAQADWIRAQGDYQVSLSQARQMNATAASMEMDNAIKWVETYFRRKEINRAYRQKMNPTYLQRVQKANRLRHLLLEKDPTYVLRGDVTGELNWMLERLAATALAETLLVNQEEPGQDKELNRPLDAETVGHLNVSQDEKIAGKKLVFRANAGSPFKSPWPLVFLTDEFQQERERFEKARDDLVAEARASIVGNAATEQATHVAGARIKSWEYLQFAVDKLSQRLVEVYPWERRREPAEYFAYMRGKRFLQAQAAGIVHAMSTNNVSLLAGDERFEGGTMYELLHHMCRRGLRFSEPTEGDRNAYRKVFLMMREIYLHYQPDAGGVDVDPRTDLNGENADRDRLFSR